ncbi:MAG: tetratricopeptide repeat protein [Thermoanaerobaculia bacterium]
MKDNKRQDLIHQAEEWVRRARPKRSLALYLKVLKANPDDTRVLNRAGDLCARLSRNTEAVSFYKRAALLLSQQGFYDKAIALCKMIIRLDPTLIEVMETLAKLQASQGLVHEAVSQYETVAAYYRQSHQPGRAIEAQQAIVELQPNDPSRRLELANLYQQHGRTKEALAQYRGISAVLISHGRAEEARQVCVKALAIDAGNLEFVAEALVDLSSSGHPEEAGLLLEAAIARNPEARHLEDRLRSGAVVSVEEPDESVAFEAPPLEMSSAESPAEPEPATPEPESEPEIELPEVDEEISKHGAIADSGEGFIDIAAELQAELEQEEEWQAAEPATPLDTQSLVDIVEGLSVEATASAADEDCDTHFSLGIAYQDMGLIDEAVGQYQKAAKDPRFLVESASRLARCFVEKGYPKLAIKWLEKGLESPTLVEEAAKGLRAQLAEIHGSGGEGNPGRKQGGRQTLAAEENAVLAQLSELDRT